MTDAPQPVAPEAMKQPQPPPTDPPTSDPPTDSGDENVDATRPADLDEADEESSYQPRNVVIEQREDQAAPTAIRARTDQEDLLAAAGETTDEEGSD